MKKVLLLIVIALGAVSIRNVNAATISDRPTLSILNPDITMLVKDFKYHAYLNPKCNGYMTDDKFREANIALFKHDDAFAKTIFNVKFYSLDNMRRDQIENVEHVFAYKLNGKHMTDSGMVVLIENSTSQNAPDDFHDTFTVGGIYKDGSGMEYFPRDNYTGELLLVYDNKPWISESCGNPVHANEIPQPGPQPEPQERMDTGTGSKSTVVSSTPGNVTVTNVINPPAQLAPSVVYVQQQAQPYYNQQQIQPNYGYDQYAPTLAVSFSAGISTGYGYQNAGGYANNYPSDGGYYGNNNHGNGGGSRPTQNIINNYNDPTTIIDSYNKTSTSRYTYKNNGNGNGSDNGSHNTTGGGSTPTGNNHGGGHHGGGGTPPSGGPYQGAAGGSTTPAASPVPGSGGAGQRGSFAAVPNNTGISNPSQATQAGIMPNTTRRFAATNNNVAPNPFGGRINAIATNTAGNPNVNGAQQNYGQRNGNASGYVGQNRGMQNPNQLQQNAPGTPIMGNQRAFNNRGGMQQQSYAPQQNVQPLNMGNRSFNGAGNAMQNMGPRGGGMQQGGGGFRHGH
jgi:hypothetical protein